MALNRWELLNLSRGGCLPTRILSGISWAKNVNFLLDSGIISEFRATGCNWRGRCTSFVDDVLGWVERVCHVTPDVSGRVSRDR